MAKRKSTGKDNLPSMDHKSFRVDETTPGDPIWYKAVCDEISQDLLAQILTALGGGTSSKPDAASSALLQLTFANLQGEDLNKFMVNDNGEILFNDAGQLLQEIT